MTLRPGIDYLKTAVEPPTRVRRIGKGYVVIDQWVYHKNGGGNGSWREILDCEIGPVWTVCDKEGKEVTQATGG